MKTLILASLLACGLLANGAAMADDALQAAIAGDQRIPGNVARDGARHPYQTLEFFGIKPTMTVVELSPGNGWYTEILAPYLRDGGKLITAGNDPESANANRRAAAGIFQKFLDTHPASFGKVQIGAFEPPVTYSFAPKGTVDMVLTFRNIHNWIPLGDTRLKQLFGSVYDSLKPGGVLGVVEHRLPAAMPQDAEASTGYLHEDYVIKLIESAGFKLVARSEINANPKDNANHKGGVWALPPTYTNKLEEHDQYEAIGESDRMTLKFIKPQ